jgi:hypothetical protein
MIYAIFRHNIIISTAPSFAQALLWLTLNNKDAGHPFGNGYTIKPLN